MKFLFLTILILLILASVLTALNMPGAQSKVPVLYWVSEVGEVRIHQRQVFDRWIVKKHAEDPVRYPLFDVVIDPANNREEKMMIQGVTGVAGDVLSASRGGFRYFRELGLLQDVTEVAKRRGFDPSTTFPQLYWEITMDGKQYGYPQNVTVPLFIVNRRTFRELGVEPPEPVADKGVEAIWTLEEFEAKGRQFMAAVEKSGRRGKTFFADKYEPLPLRRALGLSTFNETGTACVLDDPRYAKSLKLLHKWTYEDHFFPTAGEQDALLNGVLYQWCKGGYGMFMEGSWILEQLRPKPGRTPVTTLAVGDMTAVPLPYYKAADPRDSGLPNTILRSRIGSVYFGGKHKELAEIFLEFLASPEYARQLVDEPDSLPPNPRLSDRHDPLGEAFFHPAPRGADDKPLLGREHELDYEAEADAQFAWAMRELAIGTAYSPFILPARAAQIENDNYQDFMRNAFSAEEASRRTKAQIDTEMQRAIAAEPRLKREYDRRVALQRQIDQRKAAGRKIPLQWLDDPFYRKYYDRRGMTEGPGPWWRVEDANVPATGPATEATR